MKKRLLSMILALSMMLTILPVNAITALAEIGKVVKSGNCGINGESNVTYTLTQNNDDDTNLTYTLTIKGSGAMKDYSGSTWWKEYDDKITKIVIEKGVTSIGKFAFYDCSGFTGELSIPDSVTSIGDCAFYGCSGFTGELSIPDSVTSIGSSAFSGCSGFTGGLSIPDSVTSIGSSAFSSCSGFTGELSIPDSVTSIGSSAFSGCSGFTGELSIPDGVASIGNFAFSGCSGLTSVVIPSTVTTIGLYAFSRCDGLTSIMIPESVTSIGPNAFYNSQNLTKVELPLKVPAIGNSAFDGNRFWEFKIYYSGYKTDWLNQSNVVNGSVGELSTDQRKMHIYGLSGVDAAWRPIGYYIDVPFDANGGVFEDRTARKTVEKARHGDNLTQEQIDSVGVPKRAGKVCIGWSTDANATTPINLTSHGSATVDDDTVFYAVYRDAKAATIEIGSSNKTFEAGTASDPFAVNVQVNDNKEATKVKFEFANGTVQYKNSSTDWSDLTGNEIDIDKLDNDTMFRIMTPKSATARSESLTAKLVTEQGTEIGVNATADFTVTARTPATIAITEPTNKNVKAGESSQTFTMNITNHDDAVGNVTFDFDGEVQYADNTYGPNWTTVTGSVSRAIATSKYFRVVPKADAVAGDMTLTAKLVDTDGNEITGATASTTFNVTARKHAEVTINGLDTDNTVKAGNDKTFTVSVTPNDDANTGAKATIEVSGANADAVEKIQYKDGETWKDIPSDGLSIDDINNTEFKIITKADANNGNVTITVVAKKADGTEIDTKDATITVKKHENAEVTIDGLNGTVETDTEKEFTVTVTANDDKSVTAKAGFTGPENGVKKLEIDYTGNGDWQDVTRYVGNLYLNTDNLQDISYKLRVTFAEAGEYKFDVSLTKDGATTAFTSDNATVTVTKKAEPVVPGGGETGGDKPGTGENPGGGETGGGDKPGTGENPGGGETGGGDKPGTGENPGGGETGGGDKPGTGENPGGGETGGGDKPGTGENPGDGGNTKPGDGDHTGDKDPETKSYELTVIGGSFTAKQGENALTVETTKADNSLTAKIPEGAVVTVTLNKDAVPEGMVFDQWKINDDDLMGNPDVAYDQETFHFTMPEHDVKVEVMYRDATIESDGPGILGTGAMIATVGISAAALAYQGHMLGTEFALRCMLPEWALIPQNRAELAVLLWSDADSPEPVSTNLYSDISEDDSAVQKAARWAVENDLMELLDAEEAPENFDPFVPVTYLDSIHAWKKAQELKK